MKINPVLDRELKVKMRGWRAPVLLLFYLGALAIAVALIFYYWEQRAAMNMSMSFQPQFLFTSFIVLLAFELGLILLITPALTAASISGERERQTLDLLLCTKLSPLSIVLGKLSASMSHVILLLLASLPVFGVVFLYGGIDLLDFFLFMLFFLVTAVMAGSMGVCYSACFRKTVTATVITYVSLMIMGVGTIIAFFLFGSVYYTSTNTEPTYFHVLAFFFSNPAIGFISVLEHTSGFLSSELRGTPVLARGFAENPFKPWMVNIIFDLAASAIFISISTLKLRKAGRK